jgi:hypothetical protein
MTADGMTRLAEVCAASRIGCPPSACHHDGMTMRPTDRWHVSKSPGRLRVTQYSKRPDPVPAIDGLSAKVLRQITDAARAGRCGSVNEMATALGALKWFLSRPGRVLIPDPVTTCPCHDPRDALDTLNRIMNALPAPAAR